MTTYANELELDRAFWAALETSESFRAWLLQRTKFWLSALELVTNEKWHQRWYRDPETGKDSETDILLIWHDEHRAERFALHIENKPAHRTWEPSQAENYRRRAENRKVAWGYKDFEVILLAPIDFIARHLNQASSFDFVLSYEEISEFVPAFGAAIPPPSDVGPVERLKVELLRHHVDGEELVRQPWLASVRKGDFDQIPATLAWSASAPLAHMISGYDIFGVERLQALANQRREAAEQTGEWTGNALELWACLFAEHRRCHFGFDPSDEEIPLYNVLCQTLRERLTASGDRIGA